MRQILVLTDLVGSEKVEEREILRSKLHYVLGQANQRFGDRLVIPFQVVKGVDEFGAVLKSWADSFRIIDYVFEKMLPFVYRFVVVEGAVLNVESGQVSALDGNAVYEGTRLIEKMKARSSKKEKNLLMELVRFDVVRVENPFGSNLNISLKELSLDALEVLVWIIWRQKIRWTKRQREVVSRYRELKNQKELSKELGITQSCVSQILRRADFEFINKMENFINYGFNILSQYG